MTPDGKWPLPTKKYYDAFTFLITQTGFAYVVAPFILLGFSDTIKVWARVYFYTIIGVAVSFALFSRSLPIRKELVKRQSVRSPQPTYDDPTIEKAAREEIRREKLARTNSADSVASHAKMPLLGISDDP